MASDKQVAKSDVGNQVQGNDNFVGNELNLYMGPQHLLTRTVAYNLLEIIYDAPVPAENDFPFDDLVPMWDKLHFNHAPRYKAYIDNHASYYARVESEIKQFPDSELIIRKLADMFTRVANFDDNGNLVVGNGDEQLDAIKDELTTAIVQDPRFDQEKYPIEVIEEFCIALIACGIASCKILVRPD